MCRVHCVGFFAYCIYSPHFQVCTYITPGCLSGWFLGGGNRTINLLYRCTKCIFCARNYPQRCPFTGCNHFLSAFIYIYDIRFISHAALRAPCLPSPHHRQRTHINRSSDYRIPRRKGNQLHRAAHSGLEHH